MDPMRVIFLGVLTAASILVALQLTRGKWMELVMKPHQNKKGKLVVPGWTPKVAQRVGVLYSVCAVSYAALLFYDVSAMLNAAILGQVMAILSNLALLGFIACVVWTYMTFVREAGQDAKFGKHTVRVSLMVLVQVVLLTVSSVLFT